MIACLIGPPVEAADRVPLPAREIERPLVLPRGWVEVAGGWRRRGGMATPRDDVAFDMRLGLPRLHLAAGLAARPGARWRVGALSLELGANVWRDEPPNTSVAVWAAGTWRPDPRHGAMWVGIGARRQVGPFAFTARGEVGGRGAVGLGALLARGTGDVLLQTGPLAWRVTGVVGRRDVEARPWAGGVDGGLLIQFTRGVEIDGRGGMRWPVQGGAPWTVAEVVLRVRG